MHRFHWAVRRIAVGWLLKVQTSSIAQTLVDYMVYTGILMGVLENLSAFAFHGIGILKLTWVSYSVFFLLEMQNVTLSLLCPFFHCLLKHLILLE